MYQSNLKSILLALGLVALIAGLANGQMLDKILNTNNVNNDADVISNNGNDLASGQRQQQQQPPVVSRVKNLLQDMMTVNVPIFYDMVRDGSSMGINVLSGLVKVERGQEAERSGLAGNGGRKPLSVRVFGIPVFERGTRVRPLDSGSSPFGGTGTGTGAGGATPAGPTKPDEVDSLPL